MRKNLRSLITAGGLALATVAAFCGCASADRSASQYIDDRMTSRRVDLALADHGRRFKDVRVETYRGVVQLNGVVDQPEQKQAALNIARLTSGVRDVVNNITVRPETQMVTPTGESRTGQPVYR